MYKSRLLFLIPALLLLSCQQDRGYSDHAELSLADFSDAIIVDGHVDFPNATMGKDVNPLDTGGTTNFDYARAKTGGLNAPFMSIYVSRHHQNDGTATERADSLIDYVESIAQRFPDNFALAHSVAELRTATAKGLISLPMGMENGAPIEDDLTLLDHFHERGIRYITLTHSVPNKISDSSYSDDRPWGGLSPFGELVVKRMNELGIMVDVSHLSDDSIKDVLAITEDPVIASHSGARHLTPGFERNLSDELLKGMAEKGGVAMINYGSHFLTKEGSQRRLTRPAIYLEYLAERNLEDKPEIYTEFRIWFDENHPLPYASVSDVLDHIDHINDLVGVDHVGLGSDFDGVGDSLPIGLKDVSQTPNIISGLIERGYSEEDIRKVLGENLLRVWSTVESVASASPVQDE